MKQGWMWIAALLLVLVLSAGAAADVSWLMELAEANVNAMVSEMNAGDVEYAEVYFSAYHYLVAMMLEGAQQPDPETRLAVLDMMSTLVIYLHSELSQQQAAWRGQDDMTAVVDAQLARLGNTALETAVIGLEDPSKEVQTSGVLALAAVFGMLADFEGQTVVAGAFDVVVQPDPEAAAAARERLQVLADDSAVKPGTIAQHLLKLMESPDPTAH